jgi:hypothetical protein
LDVYVKLKAKIHGDITLTLLWVWLRFPTAALYSRSVSDKSFVFS